MDPWTRGAMGLWVHGLKEPWGHARLLAAFSRWTVTFDDSVIKSTGAVLLYRFTSSDVLEIVVFQIIDGRAADLRGWSGGPESAFSGYKVQGEGFTNGRVWVSFVGWSP